MPKKPRLKLNAHSNAINCVVFDERLFDLILGASTRVRVRARVKVKARVRVGVRFRVGVMVILKVGLALDLD